jgi:hypothetical protein
MAKILAAVVLFAAFASFGASAEEGQEQKPQKQIMLPAQQAAADTVTLNMIAATPPDKRDLHHRIEYPKNMSRDEMIDACAKELADFLKHKFPDSVEILGRAATCIVPEVIGDRS